MSQLLASLVQKPARETDGLIRVENETPEGPVYYPSTFENWKKIAYMSCTAVSATACAITSEIAQNQWLKAILLSSTAALLYSTANVATPLIPLPEQWSHISKMIAQSIIGSAIILPGNFFYFASIGVGLEPGSPVNLIAINSYIYFLNSLTTTAGSILYLNQPINWSVWVGIAAGATVATIQTLASM
jgi:hypothetical protein